jgi:glucose/arabinose dehydrogenase
MKKLFFLLIVVFLSCAEKNSQDQQQPADEDFKGTVIESEKQKFGVVVITDKLTNPWGIAFLPDNRILVTERAGEIRIIKDGKLLEEKVTGVPLVIAEGQGGLLDIQLHPDFKNNGWIYLSYCKPVPGGSCTTIVRAKLDGNALTHHEELFSAQPAANSGINFGSRIAFDDKGYLYFTSGERGTEANAQMLDNHLGKVLRLQDDGKTPSDNPFVNTPKAKPEIWSYGHRNPQGLIYDNENDILYAHEHGPRGGDELNIVLKGKNYGWPVITYGINSDGTPITDKTSMPGMEQPVTYYVPSIAPCGMTKISGDKYPGWKNNILIGALALTHLSRVEIAGNGEVKKEKLLEKEGRFRAVVQSPDGYVYAATEGPGKLIKLIPVK